MLNIVEVEALEVTNSMSEVKYTSMEDLEIIYKCVNKYGIERVARYLRCYTYPDILIGLLNNLFDNLHHNRINVEDLGHLSKIVDIVIDQATSIFSLDSNTNTDTNTDTVNTVECIKTTDIVNTIDNTVSITNITNTDIVDTTNTNNNTIETNTTNPTINTYSSICNTFNNIFVLSDALKPIKSTIKNTINNIRYNPNIYSSSLSCFRYG